MNDTLDPTCQLVVVRRKRGLALPGDFKTIVDIVYGEVSRTTWLIYIHSHIMIRH